MQTNDSQASIAEVPDGSVLTGASTVLQRLSAPALFDAGQWQLTGFNLALASASLSLDSLTLEQVRLRESVETLTSTLFINGNSLAPREADIAPGALKNEDKSEEQPTGFWASVGGVVGAGVGTLWDAIKDKVLDKLLDRAIDSAGKAIKGRKKIAGRGTLLDSLFEKLGKAWSAIPALARPGAPTQGFQSFAAVRNPAPSPSLLPSVESLGARRFTPIRTAEAALTVIQGVRTGDPDAIGVGLSTAGGAWAGASAGAAIGTLVLPGVGTAVGGAIGGLLGSEVGSWLGDKLFGANDRLTSPDAMSKELNSARTDNVQVSIAPSIQITGVNPADAQQVVNQVIQALQLQCMPMVTDTLGIRRNAALADPGGD
ncbi:hypothetical protein DYL59_23565 [Pseudomonas kairouanensis]|uniref:Glycine zipper domain-containing protein n=1 Tax=Pseudomonas kairouanensis TaxID=2293832 RepID=A0A4Z0AIV0_9PSED|nr:glycine zipper domain-containing protein [Pseudomonas kairouanensis]TFY86119.1 hypothetical protein DYL59_23565 [Pseudomonas kairouanensis]